MLESLIWLMTLNVCEYHFLLKFQLKFIDVKYWGIEREKWGKVLFYVVAGSPCTHENFFIHRPYGHSLIIPFLFPTEISHFSLKSIISQVKQRIWLFWHQNLNEMAKETKKCFVISLFSCLITPVGK